jgi:hypothetical protein
MFSREFQHMAKLGGWRKKRKKMLDRKQLSYDKRQSGAGLLRNRFVNYADYC